MALKKKITTDVVEPTIQEVSIPNEEMFILEQKKVKALEKIANSLDALTIWFEEIDKDSWGPRIEWYLAEFHKLVPKDEVKETETNA